MRNFLILLALGLLLVACDVNGNLTSSPASGDSAASQQRSADYALQQAQQQQVAADAAAARETAQAQPLTTRGLSPRRQLLRRWTLHAHGWP